MLLLFDFRAERSERKPRKLEALLAEGYADDGDAPNQTRDAESESKKKPAEYYPDHVGDGMLAEVLFNGRAERPERKPCKLERLFAERNTYNGYAPQ